MRGKKRGMERRERARANKGRAWTREERELEEMKQDRDEMKTVLKKLEEITLIL